MTAYQLNDDVIYREVQDELIAIQTATGAFYYFTKTSKQFFDYFKKTRTWDSISIQIPPEEIEYYKNFCEKLVNNKVLDKKELIENATKDDEPIFFEKPIFLREGLKKLEEVTSDVVLLTSTT